MLDRYYGWVILADLMAELLIGPAIIGPAIFFIIKYAIVAKTLINETQNSAFYTAESAFLSLDRDRRGYFRKISLKQYSQRF